MTPGGSDPGTIHRIQPAGSPQQVASCHPHGSTLRGGAGEKPPRAPCPLVHNGGETRERVTVADHESDNQCAAPECTQSLRRTVPTTSMQTMRRWYSTHFERDAR